VANLAFHGGYGAFAGWNVRALRKRKKSDLAMPARHPDDTAKSLNRLGGKIAHELNGALTVIVGSLQTLSENVHGLPGASPQIKRALDHAKRGTDRVLELAIRLQAAAGARELEPKRLHPGEFLSGLSPTIRDWLGASIALTLSPAQDLWTVEVDREQLEMAIRNLAINAREAMASGGKFVIEAANLVVTQKNRESADIAAGDYVVLSFRDTGEGMTAGVQERATEICFTANRSPQNLGLGLSQAESFAERSGGRLRLESKPGAGTTVKLCLPRAARERTALPSPGLSAPADARTILLVDDDDVVREYIVEALEELNYTVQVARNAQEAIAHLGTASSHFDLLLTDMGLPGTDGHELAQEALKHRPGIGILFMSGQGRDHFPAAALLSHVELIKKPMTKTALDNAIKQALRAAPPRAA
jgi:CheY-like chemotaxis protein/nitrogen-specific signal transduction histidine kinase